MHACDIAEALQHVVQEKCEPDALALAAGADAIHAVVPVAGTDQRQAVFAAQPESTFDRSHAVPVQALALRRAHRQVVVGLLVGTEQAAFDPGRGLVEDAEVAGDLHIATGRERQPQVVVGTVRAHAAIERRMPPVLHVAFGELMRGAQQQVLADELRRCMDHRQRVLQLVAKTVCAAGLIETAAAPETAGDDLVQQPAVREGVYGAVGRAYLDRAENLSPVRTHRVQGDLCGLFIARFLRQCPRVAVVAAGAEAKHRDVLDLIDQRNGYAQAGARIEPCTHAPRQFDPAKRGWLLQAAIAADELGAIAGDAARRAHRHRRRRPRPPNSLL